MRLRRQFVAFAVLICLAASGVRADAPRVAAVLQPYVDSHSLAGAVTLVASRDKVLSLEAVGFEDLAAKKPMTTDSMFWIASMSKPITAAALMILVDEGKVNVEDPVEKYLPEFRGQMVAVYQDDTTRLLKRPRHPITVKNVLSHTSGLPFASAVEHPTLDRLPLREAVLSYALTPLIFEPDTKYQYSNAGINTAGRIIEVVSGMPYERFLEERLFQPLGMKDTTFWPNDEQVSRLAKSYRPNAAKNDLEEFKISQLQYPLQDRTHRYPMPAGGYFGTARDMGRFCQMLLNGGTLEGRRYLSEAAVKQMTSKQTGDALKDGYGFGFSTNGTTFGHGGAHATNMTVDPQSGLVTVWMIQHAGYAGNGGEAQGTFNKAAKAAFGSQ
ncbi:MAG: beta-lactamase family protein [Planctomycetes bacterium]|nr:beta-lactamase family protein [Planctomycetota bacterium]